ncbi:SCO6745 family protein [Actinophytocola glycyrrhizae]|uniref:SalK n=1 Tax=Actinophytocola glycyrrhizae TaxID=2044873 RepID=A0ABV9RRJ9_9PSEU
MHPARRLWTVLEPLHAVVYFGADVRSAGKAIGLRGYWDTYFAFRAAPLGAVAAAPVTGLFAGFEPGMVGRSLPSAWSRASAETCLAARSAVSATALRAVGVSDEKCAKAVALLSSLEPAPTGRPLGAANAALPLPEDPVAALWQLATTVREHRGDGHVAALVTAGLSGLDALHLQVSAKGLDPDALRQVRGWTREQWAAARESLAERELLDADGLTMTGADVLESVEELTDAAAWQDGLAGVPVDDVVEVLAPAAFAVWDSGLLPEGNPIGVPRPA